MGKLKLYEIDFYGMWPIPSTLIILAYSEKEAMEIAKKTIIHTNPISAKLIDIDKPKVVIYLSGDY
jgi:hypothetical protein